MPRGKKWILEEGICAAGIFNTFQGEDRLLIVTTQANEAMRQVHDRMPLILEKTELDFKQQKGETPAVFLQNQKAGK